MSRARWGAPGCGAHWGVAVAPLLVAVVVAGYLAGSVPVAVLVARARGFDPRDVGDRNPGYWNVKEQVGARGSLPVFVGDVAKGAVAGAIGLAAVAAADAADPWWLAHVAVGAAMVGHAYPVFAGFRGGRSILAFVGGVLVIAPVAAAIAVAAVAITWAATRSFAVAARVGVFGFPVAQALVEPRAHVAATGALMTIIGVRFAQAALADRRRADPAPGGAAQP